MPPYRFFLRWRIISHSRDGNPGYVTTTVLVPLRLGRIFEAPGLWRTRIFVTDELSQDPSHIVMHRWVVAL